MNTAIQHPSSAPGPAAPGSDGTLGERLATHYAQRIGQRQLQPGARLPSVRDCARSHGVSPSTVVAAYDRLQAQGLIEARRQRGFYVRPSAAVAAAPRHQEPNFALPAPVDTTALIRAMFRTRASLPGPGLGTLPETWLDAALLQRALRRAIGHTDDALRYGEPAGDPTLRDALARRLSNELGIAADPTQIVTSVGATHALDIIARALAQAGRRGAGRRPGLGGGARAPHRHGHASAAGAARPGRARSRGDAPADCRTPPAPVRDGVGAAQPDRRDAVAGRCAPGAAAGRGARPDPGGGRHLRLAGAGARAAAGGARRAAAHDLRDGLLQDPGAQLASRCTGGAAGVGRTPSSTPSC